MSNKISILSFAKEFLQNSVISGNKRDIQNYGENNMFPNLLMEMYEKVPEHSASIDFIEGLIVGQGINVDNFDYWFLKKIVFDYILYGGYTVQVIKLRNGSYKYEYVDIQKVRYNKNKDKFLFCENWEDYKSTALIYDISDGSKDGIFLFKNIKSKNLYPKPYYLSNLACIETLNDIIKYHKNNAKNGFSPNVLINIVGVPDEDTQKETETEIKKKFTGDGQKFILSFSNSKEDATTIEEIQTKNLSEEFKDLQLFLRDEIIIGHKLTSPNLIGVNTAGNGFNKTEYEESLTVFKENVIQNFRNELAYSLMLLTGIKDIQFMDKEDKNNIEINN